MRQINLHSVGDQIIAVPVTLHPVAETDEAGAVCRTRISEVEFQTGDSIVVFGKNQALGMVVAFRNYAKDLMSVSPPLYYKTEEVSHVQVQD